MNARFLEAAQQELDKALALAWAELHKEELMADWQLVMNGEEPFKIQPPGSRVYTALPVNP